MSIYDKIVDHLHDNVKKIEKESGATVNNV